MTDFRKARTLEEVAAQTYLEPLPSGDPRHVDMSAGRGSDDLRQLRIHLSDVDASQNRFAQIAFTGHRGSGKSTELLRLEDELSKRFTCLHLYIDDSLLSDCDYTDLLLWLVDSLVRQFQHAPIPLDKKLVEDVLEWFAEKTLEDVKKVKKEVRAEIRAEAKAKVGVPWLSLGLLARIQSSVLGSIENRQTIRRKLQAYSTELISKVNLLLDNAQTTLERNKKRPDLLVVLDNLDRLPPEAARRLFYGNAELLKSLRAHMVYTVPVPMVLSPVNIGHKFEYSFSMPMIKVSDPDGDEFEPGLAALDSLVAARIDVDKVFTGRDVLRLLGAGSGGSVRDLIRLINFAQLAARADGKKRIDEDSARRAIKKIQLDYEGMLIPGQAYFPVLAQIHKAKQHRVPEGDTPTDEKNAQTARDFFSQLLFNGAVLQYNGERTWYDVHPAVQQIEAFKDAFAKA